MPALNFKKQFAPLVESGRKRQTIRGLRKRPFRTGDVLYLYTGMRTGSCRKLAETKVLKVETIYISDEEIIIGTRRLHTTQIADLARADGFSASVILDRSLDLIMICLSQAS